MSTSESKKITLKSSDEETFEVEEAVAVQSQTIKHVIEDNCADNTIPLPNVTGKLLAMVIEYCKKHVVGASKPDYNNSTSIDEEFKKWDANFLKDLKNDQETLFALIHAVDYLDTEENQWAFD